MKRIVSASACAFAALAFAVSPALAQTPVEAKPVAPAAGLPAAPKVEAGQAWVHCFANFANDKRTQEVTQLMKDARKAGYNCMLISDVKFEKLQLTNEAYKKTLQKFRQECRDAGMKLCVSVGAFGYCDMFLTHDPNLAEGYPTRGSMFVVKDGKLVPFDDTASATNGTFADFKGDKPAGWNVDDAGTKVFVDATGWNGKPCIRMDNPGSRVRIMQKIKVRPNTYYTISALLKSEDWTGKDNRMMAMGPDGYLNNQNLNIKKTADWTRLAGSFCSNECTEATIFIGTWDGKAGKLWIADVKVEPAGFLNIIRRDDLPLKVTSVDGKTVYEEGRDFGTVVDPKLVNDPNPGYFTILHEQPVVTVPAGSRLKEGDKVVASFHFASESGKPSQMNVCIAEPKVYDIIRDQVTWMKENVQPDMYFMGYDEMRFSGWDDSCVKTGKTPGQLLADSVAKVIRIIKEVEPGKPIATWNDMFDPYHNASPEIKGKQYYMVKGEKGKGPWAGSWEGLSSDVLILNWRQNKMEGVAFFAARGNQQVLAGYYDKDPKRIVEWLTMAKDTPNIVGVMYTTWVNDFSKIGEFLDLVKQYDAAKKP